jgi:acyl-CoA dehydrogenase
MSAPVSIETEARFAIPDIDDALNAAYQNAESVDRDSRFPEEAIAALRSAGALGWLVPRRNGGLELGLDEIAEITCRLSRKCSATGMIFAMHQSQVSCIIRHSGRSLWFDRYLKGLVEQQRLIASATSEAGVGGNVRKSVAAASQLDGFPKRISFEKQASTISYGAYADDLLTTLRSSPTADPGDQILVLTRADEMMMEPLSKWDTIGMRGTCSPGFRVRATCSREQILPAPFATIATETMVPVSHILWSHVWLGIALDAFERAQNFVRSQARRSSDGIPPTASRLSTLSVKLAAFRALVRSAINEYISINQKGNREELSHWGQVVKINNLKIAASGSAIEICSGALAICGFAGYQNAGPYSVSRHLRDAHSAPLMIANDRLLATNAAILLVHREER